MSHLIEEYNRLKTTDTLPGSFSVTSIPNFKDHKLGLSEFGLPVFFIRTQDQGNSHVVDYNLEMISIQFKRQCQLVSDQKVLSRDTYTIISLKSGGIEIQHYFLDILYLLISCLPKETYLKELKIEIENLVNLFSSLNSPPQKTIQGLWAELLLIDISKKPSILIQSWHYRTTDQYDFNNGIDKIEVKSSLRNRRIHNFAAGQLVPNKGSRLLIASILVIQTGAGKNIFDLAQTIEDRLNNPKDIFILKEKIAVTLGNNLEAAYDIFFDYQYAKDNCAFYKSDDIPQIDNIPTQISNVHFDCDLSGIRPVEVNSLRSSLFEAL